MQAQKLSQLHEAARAYAIAGIPVFPCLPDEKTPATKRGFYDATTDLAQIDDWWDKADYNIAICPDNSGLLVVDVDPGADLSFMRNLPPTYTVRTPRGGYHFYFEGSGKSTAQKLARYVDTRGVGGYVLVPPSRTDKGIYQPWTEDDYAPLPGWISESLATIDAPQKAAVETSDLPINVERAIAALKREKPGIEFQGSDQRAFEVACVLRDFNLSPETAFDLLWEHWIPRCEGEWTEDFIRLKIENAYTYGQNEAGAYAIEPPEKVFSDAVKKLQPQEKRSRFYFKDESEMDDEPDPKWLVQDLISEQSTVMIYGASGSYKSFLVLDICLAIATGKPTFGSETQPGLVFYGALEGRAHLKKARRAWRVVKEIEGKIDNFFVGYAPMIGVEGEAEEFVAEIQKRCGNTRPKLIVIDTLTKAMAGLNENDAQDAGKFIRFCDNLVEIFGCAVIAIHHNGKEETRGARGSSAFQAGFDTVLEVKAHKATKAVAVKVIKHKDAEEREQPWTFEGHLTGPSLTFSMTTPEQHRLLTGEGREISRKSVGAALQELNAFGDDGEITTAVLAAHITPTRENESVEDRSDALALASRALVSMAKKELEGYCAKRGRVYMWSLPAPKQAD